MIIRAGKMAYWVKSICMQTLQPEDMDSLELSSQSPPTHNHLYMRIANYIFFKEDVFQVS